jgi:tetratricopeptide (TPR) repeat protein
MQAANNKGGRYSMGFRGGRIARLMLTTAIAGVLMSSASNNRFVTALQASQPQPETVAEKREPDVGHSQLGSYMAGRYARGQYDTVSAANLYKRALEKDPGNETILKNAFLAEISIGDWVRTSALADEVLKVEPANRIARLYLGVREFSAKAYDKADDHFKAASSGPVGELTATLARAWTQTAKDDNKSAFDLLDGMKQVDWAQHYQRYHRALIADVTGRRPIARQNYEKLFETDTRSLRPVLAYAAHAAQSGNADMARKILAKHIDSTPPAHPLARTMLSDVAAGRDVPLIVKTPSEGLAEVFYGLGEVLASEGGIDIGTIYLQLALHLRQDSTLALAALANVYETTKQFDQAIGTYDRIPTSNPLNANIEIRKAFNLNQLEKVDEAKALLEGLAKRESGDMRPLDALGNIMRARKRFEEAVVYYGRAIRLIDKPAKANWNQYYSRGVSYERLKNWPAAESDLLKALELSPDQPLILNYLGYSWVDQGKNLKQAMGYITKAVKLKPDDGYFVDSLGWAYFRLGDYKQAVNYLERAVELRPEDPTINDHLGDAMWRVGRTFEARYQWDQALTLKPEPEEIDKIRRKVAEGLPSLRTASPVPAKKRREARKPEVRQKRVERTTDPDRPLPQ